MNQIQIGVIGSMADNSLSLLAKTLARQVGKEIAKKEAILLFSFEKDYNSLSTIAAKECEKNGGKTIAFLWGNRSDAYSLNSVRINTGQLRGGGREFSFVLSCDVIISIAGGSGTLTEIAMAYQASIPVIAIKKSGGWSSRLSNTFLDTRKRQKIIGVDTAEDAVTLAIKLAKAL